GRGAFLDCRSFGAKLAKHFPTVFAACRSAGIDPAREPIPVAPAAHYHMGGIFTDAQGRSAIDGLWACGEVASTGAHGANRLASNSLLEAVVFGALLANDIASSPGVSDLEPSALEEMVAIDPPREHDHGEHELRRTMTEDVGVIRDAASLTKALGKIGVIEGENDG